MNINIILTFIKGCLREDVLYQVELIGYTV